MSAARVTRPRRTQVVEQDFKDRLEKRCYAERLQQAQAARWGSKGREQAMSMELPNCSEIYNRFGYRYGTRVY